MVNLNCILIFLTVHEQDSQEDLGLRQPLRQHRPYFLFDLVTLYVLKFTNSCNCLNSLMFCDISNQDFTTEESRWQIVRSVVAKISLFLFAHALFVMLIRIFTKKSNPVTEEDPETIKLLNKIISNTIEQSLIFLGLYVYFLFEKAGKNGFMQAIDSPASSC